MQQDLNNDKWYVRWWSLSHPAVVSRIINFRARDRLLELAENRIKMGHHRYGKANPYLCRWSWDRWYLVAQVVQRISNYGVDGNKEHLVDVFNYILMEWGSPRHPKAHFKSIERTE